MLYGTLRAERIGDHMPGDYNLSLRVDSELKAQAEEVLSGVGMTMSGVFTMLLK